MAQRGSFVVVCFSEVLINSLFEIMGDKDSRGVCMLLLWLVITVESVCLWLILFGGIGSVRESILATNVRVRDEST